MVFFNYALRKLNAKIVYYGPGLCGKTTNLQWIHDHFEGGQRGKMISLSTEGDRTIFFDLLPLEIGTIRGMDVTLQLYTVPGQVHYNSTRQLVLRGADGVVFVADSQSTMRTSNVESLDNLEENLSLQGVELATFPHVLQFNKRDLGNLISVEDLDADLNKQSVPFFEAIATEGVGVQETLEGIVKLVMRSLRERYEPVAAAGVTESALGPTPLDVEVPSAPPSRPVAAPSVPPIESPRPPLVAPMPAKRPLVAADDLGLEDDVPTRVYAGNHPSTEEEETGLTGDGFWSLAAEKGAQGGDSGSTEAADDGARVGFAMPFADMETTTDVTQLDDEPQASAPVEALSDRLEDDEITAGAVEIPAGTGMPFEVADLTPEPYTAASVFGTAGEPAETEGVEAAGDEVLESDDRAVVAAEAEAEAGDIAALAEEASVEVSKDPTDAVDVAFGAGEPGIPEGEVEPSAAQAAQAPEQPEEGPAAPERPASWPARLRGTVDDLVASVLGPRHGRAAAHADADSSPPEPESEDELQLTPPEPPPVESVPELEPEPDVGARAWWETPLDEPPPADEIAFSEEPEEEPHVVEPAGLDEVVPEVAEPAAAEVAEVAGEGAFPDDTLMGDEPRSPAEPVSDGFDVGRDRVEPEHEYVEAEEGHGFAADGVGEPQEEKLEEAREGAAVESWSDGVVAETSVDDLFEQPADDAQLGAAAEAVVESEDRWHEEEFVADNEVDVEPPPLRDRDWDEAHTGEVLTEDDQLERGEAVAGADEARAPDFVPEVEPFEATAVAEAAPETAPRPRPITIGDGDPFGDVVDDEPTPVRQEVLPQVVVAPLAGDNLVRAGDNQLHLRLHGTGAIAESGQVRALDIEVPVPGSWVGNRRVTLQLRLTLSPVPEDDDGGPGGAP